MVLCLLLLPFGLSAQVHYTYCPKAYHFPVSDPDTVSMSEMVKHFDKLFAARSGAPLNDRLSRTFLLSTSPLMKCPLLSSDERRSLSARWQLQPDPKDSLSTVLVLRQIVLCRGPGTVSSVSPTSVFTRLRQHYGGFLSNIDSAMVIPARWVDGSFASIDKAHPYADWWVSDSLVTYDFRYGLFLGTCTSSCFGSYAQFAASAILPPSTASASTPRRIPVDELTLLARFVNRDSPLVMRTNDSFDVALLLYIDASGKSSISPLYPKKFTDFQRIVVRRLIQTIDSLPAWSIGCRYLSDGRILPGRYLVGNYHTTRGWTFQDALNCTLEKFGNILYIH
jgi:hypothetical protein